MDVLYNTEINKLKANEVNGVCKHVPIRFHIERRELAHRGKCDSDGNPVEDLEITYNSEIRGVELETKIMLRDIYRDEEPFLDNLKTGLVEMPDELFRTMGP